MLQRPDHAEGGPPAFEDIPQDAILVPMDAEVLGRIFTPERVRLLNHLRLHGPEPSLEALAQALGRAPSHVGTDVKYLLARGMVRVRREGHSKRVEATGRLIVVH